MPLSVVLIDDQFGDWTAYELRRRHIDVRVGMTLADAQVLLREPYVVAFIDARIPRGDRRSRPDPQWGLRALEIARGACPSACNVLATAYPTQEIEREARARGAEFEIKPLIVSTMLRYVFRGIGMRSGLPPEENLVLAELAIERRIKPTAVQLGALAALDFRACDAREHLNMSERTFKDHKTGLLDCMGVRDFRAAGELVRERARARRCPKTRNALRG